MSIHALSSRILEALEARGLRFDRFSTPDGRLQFICPQGWTAVWKEEYASITHGTPPKGHLTVYPVGLRQQVTARELLDAFLNEFVEPATEALEPVQHGPLERAPEVHAAELELTLAGRTCRGMALAWAGVGSGRMVSYWVDAALFRRGPIEDLLLAVLGSLEAPEGSPYREREVHIPPLSAQEMWPESSLETPQPFAAQEGRFAVRLPEGWRGLEVDYGGEIGWLLVPPGVTPGQEDAPLITISGADLVAPLEQTLEEALRSLSEGELFKQEQGPKEVAVREEPGLVQVRLGMPPETPGKAVRIWSLGVTDGSSVVHLLAVAEAAQMLALLPALGSIGRSLKILPRVQNLELMRQLQGAWRFLDSHSPDSHRKDEEVDETTLLLRADGTFSSRKRKVDPRNSIGNRPTLEGLNEAPSEGTWEVVQAFLSLYREDGTREIFEIESLAERSAIVGQIFWERL